MKALVVDDDLPLADIVSFTLRRAGYEVIVAYDGVMAINRWHDESPDLIVLDLNLPKLDGLKVCEQIRREDDTPIIILSVRGEEDDIVRGLKFGADDYIVKPFSPRQLEARAEAVLRRSNNSHVSPSPLRVGKLSLDPARTEVVLDGEHPRKLTMLECKLLETLMINRNQVLPFDSIIDHVWGPTGGDRAMLKQLVYRLRHKIEPDPSHPTYIETITGIGYTMSHPYRSDKY
jgi:DNA-binding response OmpR family regulator